MLTTKEMDFSKKLVLYYINDLRRKGYPVGNVTRVEFNKSNSSYGTCCRNVRGYTISLAEMAIKAKKYLSYTILHELIHTMPKCYNHGKQFQAYAKEISKIYNVKIQTYSLKEENIATKEYKLNNSRYVVRCSHCGNIMSYERNCKFVKAVRDNGGFLYKCTYCDKSKFELLKG